MNFTKGPLIQNTPLGFPRLCGNLINMQYLIWKSTTDILYRKDTANGFFLLWSKKQQINLRRVIIKKQIPLFIFFYQNLLRQVLVFPCSKVPIPVVFPPSDFRRNNSPRMLFGVAAWLGGVRAGSGNESWCSWAGRAVAAPFWTFLRRN